MDGSVADCKLPPRGGCERRAEWDTASSAPIRDLRVTTLLLTRTSCDLADSVYLCGEDAAVPK